jgi:hypothetical protein
MTRDPIWYLTLIVIGVVVGSLASFALRGSLLRNLVIGVFVALGLGLALEVAGIHLPFEPWLRSVMSQTAGSIGRFFEGMVAR